MADGAPVLRVLLALGGEPAADLAREEALLRTARQDGPAILLYGWDRPVLVLGYGQDPASVDMAACAARDVPVLRRITGGTGVLHGTDLAASLVLPPDHPWARSIPGLYQHFLATLVLGLKPLGVSLEPSPGHQGPRGPRSPLCFEDDWGETLRVAGRKAVGCAQARRKDGVLVHGVLLRGVDTPLQAAAFGMDEARILAALGPVGNPPPARTTMADSLANAIADALRLAPREDPLPPLPDDLETRYADPRWAPTTRPGRP